MDNGWKQAFVEKLSEAQGHWLQRFERAIDDEVAPVYKELTDFVRNHEFEVSTPLYEGGRRSFKFELAENAYLLMIFRSAGVGEFELRCECFVPGSEPALERSTGRISEIDRAWAEQRFQDALDTFVDLLSGTTSEPMSDAEFEELLEV